MDNSQPPNEPQVVNLGDVTEKIESPLTGERIEINAMKALPKSHKHLAAIYPTAKGWTQEAGSVALHF